MSDQQDIVWGYF